MTLQIICLLIGAVLPYLWFGVSLRYTKLQLGSIDLDAPRLQAARLTGAGARARDAQHNAWEALVLFGVANVTALVAGVEPTGHWALAAVLWVSARLLHGGFYIVGMALMRGLCFAIGVAMSLWIFGLALAVDLDL
ncbi:MAG: MAPEG family protein [Gammaproteobacteria bacterium]|nr:MAPEG family protein [Gammaproteobacteria bacterium]MYF50386.1 MAPEG family protein [Gammaproteobacteria bacterium]MYH16339.1 MAPEG family protein [Gammaproteobacteria bacterium]MYK80978.1 MAPEG family protein [Gammaproteobacteria bacterium]